MKKVKTKKSKVEEIVNYLDRAFYETTSAFANNDKIVRKDSDANYLQFMIIGRMLFISELKRFINYIEREENK